MHFKAIKKTIQCFRIKRYKQLPLLPSVKIVGTLCKIIIIIIIDRITIIIIS